MVRLDYSLDEVTLSQLNTFEPILRVRANFKYTKYQNTDPESVDIMDLKCKLSVRNEKKDWFEIGDAELEGRSSVYLGDSVDLHLLLRFSPYVLHRIEELRAGNNLWFRLQQGHGTCVTRRQTGGGSFDSVDMQQRNAEWKYPMSEWIDHLNTTEFNKIELVEIPKISLPKIQLTDHIMEFLSESNRALNEGRYGDVLQECRKALDALDKGVEEWATSKPLTEIENTRIKQSGGKDVKKEIYLSKLIGDENKAKRLNMIRGALHFYLSLDPHQSEYKGMEFTLDDAKFVLHAVTGFINNMLKYLSNKLN